jgi:hypothetical protein
MVMPYRARANERTLLNLPGFNGGAFVYVYVEDTSARALGECAERCEDDCDCGCDSGNFEPYVVFEIADCSSVIGLGFDVDTEAGRENSIHKLETLESALRMFRAALVAEFGSYDRRERELESLRD